MVPANGIVLVPSFLFDHEGFHKLCFFNVDLISHGYIYIYMSYKWLVTSDS